MSYGGGTSTPTIGADHTLPSHLLTRQSLIVAISILSLSCPSTSPPAMNEVLSSADDSVSTWRVVEHLRIGRTSRDADYTFVQVHSIDAGQDGAIYVLDPGNFEVKAFHSDGTFWRRFGAQGAGPGEFVNRWGLVGLTLLSQDTLGVLDFLSSRLIKFSLRTGNATSVTVPWTRIPLGPVPRRTIAVADDRLIIHLSQGFSVPRQPERENTHLLVLWSLRDSTLDTLRAFRGADVVPYVAGRRVFPFPKPFSRSWQWAVAYDGTIALGYNEEYKIAVSDLDGSNVRNLRYIGAERPIKEADRREWLAAYPFGSGMANIAPGVRRAAEDALADAEFPKTWPAFTQLVFDEMGRLWVRRPSGATEPKQWWDVFGQDLRPVAQIDLPRGLDVLKISERHLYGREINEMGVEQVVVYGITG